MRAVLDTNVVVSAIISADSPPDRVLRAWRGGSFQVITSAPLLEELADVLARPHIRKRTGFTASAEAALVAEFRESAIVVAPTERLNIVSDADDNKLFEAAAAGEADYLVSGDSQVLRAGTVGRTAMVTPARFAAILSESRPPS